MKCIQLFALLVFSMCLSGCAPKSMSFIKLQTRYDFSLERDLRQGVIRGKVLERTDDGWILIKYEQKERWLNGNQILLVSEVE